MLKIGYVDDYGDEMLHRPLTKPFSGAQLWWDFSLSTFQHVSCILNAQRNYSPTDEQNPKF